MSADPAHHSLDPLVSAAYSGVKVGGPFFINALHSSKYGRVGHIVEGLVKTYLTAEVHGASAAMCHMITDVVLMRMVGATTIGTGELAAFIATHEAELTKAADTLPSIFSRPETRSLLASMGSEGPTPEGARAIAKGFVNLVAPVGHALNTVIHGTSSAVSGIFKTVGEHSQYVDLGETYVVQKKPENGIDLSGLKFSSVAEYEDALQFMEKINEGIPSGSGTREIGGDRVCFDGLSESETSRQLHAGLSGSSESLHPDVRAVIDDFRAFASLGARMDGYKGFSEGFNALASNRYVDPGMRKFSHAGAQIFGICGHVDQLMKGSEFAAGRAVSAAGGASTALAAGGHVFAIGTAAFSVLTMLLGEDEEEGANGFQELAIMISQGFQKLSEQLEGIHSDVRDIKTIVTILPQLIESVHQRLKLQIGHLSDRLEDIAKHFDAGLEEIHTLLLDMRREDDAKIISKVKRKLLAIKNAIDLVETRHSKEPQKVGELVAKMGPRLEEWILSQSKDPRYTGGHRKESDEISKAMWAKSTAPGFQIARIARDIGNEEFEFSNPEIVLMAASLYVRLRRLAVLHKVPYDLDGRILEEIQVKMRELSAFVTEYSKGGILEPVRGELEMSETRWVDRFKKIIKKEMEGVEIEHFKKFNFKVLIGEMAAVVPRYDAIGRSANHFSYSTTISEYLAGRRWTHHITPMLETFYEGFVADLMPTYRGALNIEDSVVRVPAKPLVTVARCHGNSGDAMPVPMRIPDRFLASVKAALPLDLKALFLGEALGSWHIECSYGIEGFLVKENTDINDNYQLTDPVFVNYLEALIGATAQFRVRFNMAINEGEGEPSKLALSSVMVFEVPLKDTDLYIDGSNCKMYPYCVPLLLNRAMQVGVIASQHHELKIGDYLRSQVEERKKALREMIIEKAKGDIELTKITQYIQARAAELGGSLTFCHAPGCVGEWVGEVYGNPTSWLGIEKIGLYKIPTETRSFAAVKMLTEIPSWTDTSQKLLGKITKGIFSLRSGRSDLEAWVRNKRAELELGPESLSGKLADVQSLFPPACLETRALAAAIALDEARPVVPTEAERMAESMRQVVDENRLLQEQVAAFEASRLRTEALIAALAAKFDLSV